MRRCWSAGLFLLLAGLAGTVGAHESGIASLARVRSPQAPAAMVPGLSPAAFETSARHDRLDGAVGGSGWWRLQPSTSSGERLLLVLHPFSARLTVLMPPDYRPQRQSIFDPQLDPRYSRRALVFPIRGDGPIFIGVEHARYPLQVAVRSVDAYAVSDRSHLQALYSTTGVLIGVCLVALVFWLVLSDRVYLLYAGCMAAQLLYVLCAYGEAYALPGLRGLGRLGAAGIWLVATLATIVSVSFLVDFGELRARTPRLSRVLVWVGCYAPALTLVLLAAPWPQDKSWFPNLGNALLMLANALAIVCLLLAWRRGGRYAGMMLLAWVPLVAVSTARAVQLSSGTALTPLLEYGLPLVLAFAAVVLMLGMANRMLAFRRERDRAQLEAERDPLTGVLNSAGIKRRLDWALAASEASHQPLTVLFLDIDHFKRINDSHGHAIGDACLGALVRIITAELQYGDHVGRLGGEEFLLVMPGVNRRSARDTAESIRRSVETRCRQIAGVPLEMTVSIGVADSRPDDTVGDLIARADAAMYAAKGAGRNRVVSAHATEPVATG
ncbi:sensor domain-containing diguanylate cyclase [Cognatiluteimonas profundi]|uniref:sensor domain-containing diguanylate cyclase n=1 Tax=Cognatiluteimonas profundi TaxID=2594501 RepID=UPI00131DD8C7|nr:diguanylate cyclase [Lysobacter profundi]